VLHLAEYVEIRIAIVLGAIDAKDGQSLLDQWTFRVWGCLEGVGERKWGGRVFQKAIPIYNYTTSLSN
jgi:hypothetical protein